jgi:hypothetical protein
MTWNRNTVVIRVAALDQKTLASYLQVFKIGLRIISVQDKNATQATASAESDDKFDVNANKFPSVYVEEIYRSLESSRTKYAIDFEVIDRGRNGKWMEYYPGEYNTVLISSDFPEELWISKQTTMSPSPWAMFEFKLELKAGSIFSSYYDPCCLHMISPMYTTISDNFWTSNSMNAYQPYHFDIDGPKKARITIRSLNLGTFSVGFINV